MIVFPAIDLRQGRCVRLQQGRFDKETVYSNDPIAVAAEWARQGAEWLHVVNLDGALGEASPNAEVMARIAARVGVPVQFGGGLRDLAAIEKAFMAGAARVVLGTVAVREPALVREAVRHFGSDVIVVGIDAKDGLVATQGWTETTTLSALELARRMADCGVVRIVHTDIGRDGMLRGVNVEATVALAQASGLKVIVSGGVSGPDDIRRLVAIQEPLIEGIVVGQALYAGALSLREAISLAKAESGGN